MSKILILYASEEGQTARIARFLGDVARREGHEAVTFDVRDQASQEPPATDAVIIGASVHMGRHPAALMRWIKARLDQLNSLPSAFFSVSLAAASSSPKERAEAQAIADKFIEQSGWRPGHATTFAGALRYTRYGWLKRILMRWIAAREGSSDLDTQRDYEYTDWQAVENFAQEFLSRTGLSPQSNKQNK